MIPSALFIRERRLRGVFSQAEAASAAGVSQASYSRLERGGGVLSQVQLEGLAGLFGCRVCELLVPEAYPSAPADGEARREFFARRNALLQGIDPGAAVVRARAGFEAREAARAGVPGG